MGQARSKGMVLSRILPAGLALLAGAVVGFTWAVDPVLALPVVEEELVSELLVLDLSLLLCWLVGTELEGSSLGRLLLVSILHSNSRGCKLQEVVTCFTNS